MSPVGGLQPEASEGHPTLPSTFGEEGSDRPLAVTTLGVISAMIHIIVASFRVISSLGLPHPPAKLLAITYLSGMDLMNITIVASFHVISSEVAYDRPRRRLQAGPCMPRR